MHDVNTILAAAKPMLDFTQTRRLNGKVVADLRQQVRDRVLAEKGSELAGAAVAHKTVVNYKKYSAERYKRFIK